MISSGYQFDQEILERYHLSIEEIKSSKGERRVYLVKDLKDHSLKILKINLAFPKKLKRECNFLNTASSFSFNYLKTPKVFAYEHGMILMEHLNMVAYTRDTILEKNWDENQIFIWHNAIAEFQSIQQQSKSFNFYEKIKGAFYPVIRSMEISKQLFKTLTLAETAHLLILLLQYIIARLFIKNVTTHYDLNTFNFTNLKDTNKMSLIDFEMGAYKGDSYYDVLYYLSMPVSELPDWTFQKKILSGWIKMDPTKNRFLNIRLRALLCIISFQRIKRFKAEPLLAVPYRENLKLLLNKGAFTNWLHLLPTSQNEIQSIKIQGE